MSSKQNWVFWTSAKVNDISWVRKSIENSSWLWESEGSLQRNSSQKSGAIAKNNHHGNRTLRMATKTGKPQGCFNFDSRIKWSTEDLDR